MWNLWKERSKRRYGCTKTFMLEAKQELLLKYRLFYLNSKLNLLQNLSWQAINPRNDFQSIEDSSRIHKFFIKISKHPSWSWQMRQTDWRCNTAKEWIKRKCETKRKGHRIVEKLVDRSKTNKRGTWTSKTNYEIQSTVVSRFVKVNLTM